MISRFQLKPVDHFLYGLVLDIFIDWSIDIDIPARVSGSLEKLHRFIPGIDNSVNSWLEENYVV